MRVAELSRRTGVSVATIKYYLREGLLPQGELTSPNQARYGEDHVRRLRLIRALLDVGDMSVSQVREVLAAVDGPHENVHHMLGVVQDSIGTPRGQVEDESWRNALREVEALLERQRWRAKTDSPAARTLAAVIVRLRELGHGYFFDELGDVYAQACERIARVELDVVSRIEKTEDLVEAVVVGTVLGDAVLAALRRLAQEDASSRVFEGES